MQDPLTLMLLGPTAKGAPGLLGVATLSLHIEDAQHDFSDTCSSRAQPLPLISPSGEKIGHITAAARIVCCQPAAAEQLESQASQDSIGSTAKVSSNSNSRAAPAAVQQLALVSASSLAAEQLDGQSAEQPAALFRTVSAAVQTDAPQAQDRSSASSQPLQESVQHPLHPRQELQTEAGTAASSMAVSKEAGASQPTDAPGVVQPLHFHIYPPASHAVPASSSQQQAAHPPPVIKISQPTCNFAAPTQVQAAPLAEPLDQTSSQTHAVLAPVTDDPEQRLQQVQPPAAQGSTAVAGDMQQTLHQLQAAVEQLAASSKANQAADAEALQLCQAADDFESWRPVTSVPINSSTAAEANGLGRHSNGSVADADAESLMPGQYCSGAHALTFRQTKPCNHQVLCLCRTLCQACCAKLPLPSCKSRRHHIEAGQST